MAARVFLSAAPMAAFFAAATHDDRSRAALSEARHLHPTSAAHTSVAAPARASADGCTRAGGRRCRELAPPVRDACVRARMTQTGAQNVSVPSRESYLKEPAHAVTVPLVDQPVAATPKVSDLPTRYGIGVESGKCGIKLRTRWKLYLNPKV